MALGGLLQEPRLLDLAGRPDSGGVWSPCLSYADGPFHLVYSDVTGLAGAFKDVRNRVTTAPDLAGPWPAPVPFPSHGFDPSLFHDDGPDGDGRSWALWMEWDHRPGRHPFAGILLQEWDRARGAAAGPVHRVFTGTELTHTQGPHLYRRDGWYYLLTAEGGTSWNHAVTVARARALTGPYEADPAGPLLTSRHHPDAPLQKAGHGSLVETPGGYWYLAHLTARPLTPRGACVLGRETALQRVERTADGWLRLAGEPPLPGGDALPRTVVPVPAPVSGPAPAPLPLSTAGPGAEVRPAPPWSTLRRHPDPEWIEPVHGGLRLYGGQSLGSTHGQSLVARRQQATGFDFSARLDARPDSPLRTAGLVHHYNTTLRHYLHLTWDDALVPTVGATEHLIELGHTRIAHPAGPRQLLCSRARADGYRATMERAELPVPAGFVPHGDFNDASGRRETARLLDALAAAGEEPPTAIFAASDLQALGAFEELRSRGRRIPEDVSVVGFDDLPVARWTHPALTTVRQPLFDMAAMAANTLLRIIDGEHVENLRLELATRLVVRGSTAPPA